MKINQSGDGEVVFVFGIVDCGIIIGCVVFWEMGEWGMKEIGGEEVGGDGVKVG